MAIYRNISMAFWTDSKVVDDFTPEDRYIYLYCLTNPHTNLCGCYEVSVKQIADETGYNTDTVKRLLVRLDNTHNVIRYSSDTKELLILNWSRYNWSRSEKLDKPILEEIRGVKSDSFREYLADRFNVRGTVSIPYEYCIDTRARTDTVSVSDTVSESERQEEVGKKERHKRGKYGWVRLTDDEYERLCREIGEAELERCIAYVDESAQTTGNKNKWKDWNLVIRKCSRERWGLNRLSNNGKDQKANGDRRSFEELLKERAYNDTN